MRLPPVRSGSCAYWRAIEREVRTAASASTQSPPMQKTVQKNRGAIPYRVC
jgi:hypothetical protein